MFPLPSTASPATRNSGPLELVTAPGDEKVVPPSTERLKKILFRFCGGAASAQATLMFPLPSSANAPGMAVAEGMEMISGLEKVVPSSRDLLKTSRATPELSLAAQTR